MLFAELDATGWAIVVGAVFLGLAKIVEMVLTYLREKELKRQLHSMAEVGKQAHALANSAMLSQKKMHAVKCRASALETPSPVNLAEAEAAEEVYREHKAQQEKMEAQEAEKNKQKSGN